MILACQHEVEIVFQRSDAGHPDLEKFFDQIGMGRYEFFGPSRFDGVLTNVALEAHANHVAAQGKRNALRSRMRRAAGSKDQFLNLVRMVQCQQLRHDPTHGVAADNRLFHPQMIENSGGIIGEHLDRIFLHRFA